MSVECGLLQKKGKWREDFREQGAEESIWILEGSSKRRLEKTE